MDYSNIWLIIVPIVAYLLRHFLKDLFTLNFSFSSLGGVSLKTSDKNLQISGNIVSVLLNGVLVFGDRAKPSKGYNTIRQSNPDYSIDISGGHVSIIGEVRGLKVNNKKII